MSTWMIVDDDGLPKGVVDLAEVHRDAIQLMFRLSAVARDPAAVDRLFGEWMTTVDRDGMGYIAAAALSCMAKDVVGALLEIIAALAPEIDLAAKLAECSETYREFGGGA